MKNAVKERRFQDFKNIKKNVTAELNAVPLHIYDNCFEKLLERQKNYIAVTTMKENKTIFFLFTHICSDK